MIDVNDMYSVPIDQNTEAQYWIALAARKNGGKDAFGTYKGKLYAAALEGDRIPGVKGSADGSNNADYLGEVEFAVTPFDPGQYRANGGYDIESQAYTGLAILNAGLSGRGKSGALDRGGQVPVLVTLRGEEVGVEFPASKMKAGFRGSLIHAGDLVAKQREAEDTIYLNKLFVAYFEGSNKVADTAHVMPELPELRQYGIDPSAGAAVQGAVSNWGSFYELPAWYPAEWIPQVKPWGEYLLKPPFFGGFMNLSSVQYKEEQHLAEVWPVYKAALSKHPGYREKENLDTDLEPECDTLFKIGKYTVNVYLVDSPDGTKVMVMIQE